MWSLSWSARRQAVYLVQHEGAAMRSSDCARPLALTPVAPAAEELVLERNIRARVAGDFDERPVPPRAELVNDPRQQALSRPRRPHDQRGVAGGSGRPGEVEGLPQSGVLTDHRGLDGTGCRPGNGTLLLAGHLLVVTDGPIQRVDHGSANLRRRQGELQDRRGTKPERLVGQIGGLARE